MSAVQPLLASENSVIQQQRQAMVFARIGQHQRAIQILQSLRNNYPDRYSVQRDYILVASWMGDCDRVIDGYRSLQKKYQRYSRVAVPAAKCLREQNRVRGAIRVLEAAQARNPGNRELNTEWVAARKELSAQKDTTEYELESDSSDAGNREWRGQAMVWGEIADRVYGRARFTTIFADDSQFATGTLNRVGMGIDYTMDKVTFDGEVSGDIERVNEVGLSTAIFYRPDDFWKLKVAHNTFSEDVPMRAKAQSITGNQSHVGANFHSQDYVWELLMAMNAMDFSDTNRRREWYAELGYGLDLKPDREKRLMFEVWQSTNTLGGTVYYNPLSAQTLSGGYKLTRVYKGKYKRKTSEWYTWLGSYQQQNFGSDVIYGTRYGQNIELDNVNSFKWYVAAASKVYDGTRESQVELGLRYTRVLQ
ncbi:MAG: tetratricopeptide repeat protein [Acidiferrobacterales bacterium]